MQRNWYVICTTQKQEKKVATLLTKKGIENFCPHAYMEVRNVSRVSLQYNPLFQACVFVYTTEDQLSEIRKMPYVVNPMYFGSKPAIVNPEEINAIQMITENYRVIQPERSQVSYSEKLLIREHSVTSYSNKIMNVQHHGITVTLPSLGYTLVTRREKVPAPKPEQKKSSLGKVFAERIAPLFSFGF